VYLPVSDAVERMPSLAGASFEERAERLGHLVLQHHWMPASLRALSLRDAWRVVRDTVEAVERGSVQWSGVKGAEKLQLAEAVVWRVVARLGGLAELRALLLVRVPGGGVGRALVSWVVTEPVVRALVRYTIELALRESWSRERRVEVMGLNRTDNSPGKRRRDDR